MGSYLSITLRLLQNTKQKKEQWKEDTLYSIWCHQKVKSPLWPPKEGEMCGMILLN